MAPFASIGGRHGLRRLVYRNGEIRGSVLVLAQNKLLNLFYDISSFFFAYHQV
jgi:hypothetical protein